MSRSGDNITDRVSLALSSFSPSGLLITCSYIVPMSIQSFFLSIDLSLCSVPIPLSIPVAVFQGGDSTDASVGRGGGRDPAIGRGRMAKATGIGAYQRYHRLP